jgi:hypothetical protein
MKKKLLVGLLSAAMLALNGPAAQAGLLFGHCHGCGHCKCGKYSTYLCIRPYNAFSPVCCGSVTCIGCCPMMGGMGFGMGGPEACMPSCFNGCCGPSYASSGCCDSGCLPPAGAVANGPAGQAPNAPLTPQPNGPTTPTFTAPGPTPIPTSQQWPAPLPYGYGVVQTAGYQQPYPVPQPAYYPGYYPGYNAGYYPGYYPTMPSYHVPSYWYGGSQ